MQLPAQTRRVRFGPFEADLRSCELRKHGLKVKLQGQPFQVLVLLLQRPGEMISRQELHQKLWPSDTFVDFDVGLNNAIKRLRAALNDEAGAPLYVETLPRRGYRLIVPVENVEVAGVPKVSSLAERLKVAEPALPASELPDAPLRAVDDERAKIVKVQDLSSRPAGLKPRAVAAQCCNCDGFICSPGHWFDGG